MQREFIVSENSAGIRLDKFLVGQMPEFSRSEIQRFSVSRGGVAVKFSDKVHCDEMYVVIIPDVPTVTPEINNLSYDFDLDILYQDDDIIVINKPRGVVMYPSVGNKTGTLVQNLLRYTPLSSLGGEIRPGVVHRLDKDTSGVMVFAKTDVAYRRLVKIFAEHNLIRKYDAFVWGIPNWEDATITGNIARSSRNRQKMTMVKSGGKPATTEVKVANVWTNSGISQFKCNLLTGRTHQIRVHLSVHGFPVLCDPIYGRGTTRFGTVKNPELLEFLKTHNGQMLHASYLSFVHPINGKTMTFKAPLPNDMLVLRKILENA